MEATGPVAFESLIAHREWVRRLARSLVLDEARAEDLEQEVWLEALVRPPREGRSPRGWLATALRHNAIDESRTEKRRARREQAAARRETEPSSAELVAEADALQRVVRAVVDLDEPYRSTLLRRFFEDEGPTAIAARDGVPIETVRTRLRRGLDLVRARFDREHEGDRRAWCLLVLPLARRAGPIEPVAGTAGTAAALLSFLASKAAIAAAVLAAAGLGAWAWSASGVPAVPAPPPAPPVAFAAAPPPPPAPMPAAAAVVPEPAPGMRLEVLVRDATDRPVPDAAVALLDGVVREETSFASTDVRTRPLVPPSPRETRRTDGEGRAIFEALPAGDWAFVATARGGASRPMRVRSTVGGAPPPLRLLLLPAHAVEGRIVRGGGKPVEGALLSLMPTGGRGGRDAEAAAKTDANGAFRLEGVRPGRYMAMATLPGGAMQATPREVVVPGAESLEMALDDGSSARVRVFDDATGAAVPGARVAIQVMSPGPPPAFGLVTASTGADGALAVEGLPAGQLQRLLVRAPGFLPFPGPKDAAAFAAAALAPGKPFEATVRLRKGATLRGRVTDSAGKPVPKAEVSFAWSETTRNMVIGYRSDPVLTDDAGAYSIPSAGHGTGIVVVRAEGHRLPELPPDLSRALSGSGIPEALRVALPESGEAVKDLVLAACGSVEGSVVDGDGKPVPGAAVSVEGPAVEPMRRWMEAPAAPPVWTDSAGRYRLVGIAPGEVAVRAVHGPRGLLGRAGPATVASGGAATLRVEVVPGAVLAGSVVREDGTPVVGAVLRLGTGGVEHDQEMFREKVLAALEADAEAHPVGAGGAFRVAGLAPGKYALFAAAEGCSPVRGVEVVLAAGEARGDLRLVLGGERLLVGRVVDENGAPLPGARIFVQDTEQARIDPTGTAAGETDAEGRFRVAGLAAPRYRVRAEAPGCPAESGEGAPGGPEIVLRLRRGLVLAGVVADAESGKPLAAIPVHAERLRARSIHERGGGTATTGPDGSFRIEGLRAGPYRIVAGDTEGGSPYAAEVLASVEAGTTDLRVSLRKGAAIAGRVVDEQGKPMSSRVVVWAARIGADGKPDLGPAQRSAAIGADGAFRLEGLVPGRYLLTFNPIMGPDAPGYVTRRVEGVETGASDLMVRMTKGIVVKGRVVKEDGSPPGGRGGILTVRPSGAAERDFSGQMSVPIGPDGSFATEPLDPERAWDFVAPSYPGLVGASATGVKPGEGEVVLTLRKGGTIRGRVLDEEGRPVPGLWVAAQAAGAERAAGAWAQAQCGDDGVFVLEGLGDVQYRIKTMGGEFQPSTSEREFVSGDEAEIRVKRGFVLAGRLLDAAGKGAKREALFATVEGSETGIGVSVGDDGAFRFAGLPKGRVVLWLRDGAEKVELGSFDAPADGLEVRVPAEK